MVAPLKGKILTESNPLKCRFLICETATSVCPAKPMRASTEVVDESSLEGLMNMDIHKLYAHQALHFNFMLENLKCSLMVLDIFSKAFQESKGSLN